MCGIFAVKLHLKIAYYFGRFMKNIFRGFDIQDFEARRLHAWNKIKWLIPDDKKLGRFLDIGCGSGNGVIAALQHGYTCAVGLDRDFEEFSWFKIDYFDALCDHYKVNPSQAVMIQADLFSSSLSPNGFNCVMLLDSIEHVPEPAAFIKAAATYVSPGGYLLLDTCPLYFSQQGHHLFNHIPNDLFPWAHLRGDFKDIVNKYQVDDWSIRRFSELNKVTHDSIVTMIKDVGLEVVTEERGVDSKDSVALLEQHRGDLVLANIDERWLFEDWICIVAKKPQL